MPRGDEVSTIKIIAQRGGSVAEVSQFLRDLEGAYNALYWFNVDWLDPYPVKMRRFDPYFRLIDRHDPRVASQIVPEFQLQLTRISIQSPGWVEVLGSLNPLQQLREYLKDRHERSKDKSYREAAERDRLQLENAALRQALEAGEVDLARKRLALLEDYLGDDEAVRQVIWRELGPQISRLGRHQDSGLIAGAKEGES